MDQLVSHSQYLASSWSFLSLPVHAINALANAATRGSLNAHTADGHLGPSLIMCPCGPGIANFENARAVLGAMEK